MHNDETFSENYFNNRRDKNINLNSLKAAPVATFRGAGKVGSHTCFRRHGPS